MRRSEVITAFAALAACVVLASCKGLKIRGDARDPVVEVEAQAPPSPAGGGGSGAEDRHWIRSDEVFVVMYDGSAGQNCFEVTPATMLEGPTEATKGQSKVFELRGGKERWSADVYRSRPAERADLKPQTRVIFFKGPMAGGRSHGAPPSKKDARPGADAWFCSTVSDNSEIFKGEVKVAGYDYAVKEEALRVVEQ